MLIFENSKGPVDPDDMTLVNCEPTNTVVSDNIALPNTLLTHSGTNLHAFFRFQTPQTAPASTQTMPASGSSKKAITQGSPGQLMLDVLRRPLPLPLSLRNKGLTRSQLLFSIGTLIDARALRITGDDEFFLFMDMRIEFQWTSFGMMVPKWAPATKIYNAQLKELAQKKGIKFIKKHPRALMEKLGKIEPKITERILKDNYHYM